MSRRERNPTVNLYGNESGAVLSGIGCNRVNGNFAGSFEVSFYYSPFADFLGADSSDLATSPSARLLSTTTVDISALTGSTARSLAFNAAVTFAGSGISEGDEVWLRIGDGPDNGNLDTFDEPIIDNLTLTPVPEPSTVALGLLGGVALLVGVLRRRS